jgi:hypothetical protein
MILARLMLSVSTDAKRGDGLLMSCSLASREGTMIDAAITRVEANRSVMRLCSSKAFVRSHSSRKMVRFISLISQRRPSTRPGFINRSWDGLPRKMSAGRYRRFSPQSGHTVIRCPQLRMRLGRFGCRSMCEGIAVESLRREPDSICIAMPVGRDQSGASATGQKPQVRAGRRASDAKNGGACRLAPPSRLVGLCRPWLLFCLGGGLRRGLLCNSRLVLGGEFLLDLGSDCVYVHLVELGCFFE